jgi:hypothetical protein
LKKIRSKSIWIIFCGCALFLAGLILTISRKTFPYGDIGAVGIIVGLVVIRFANLPQGLFYESLLDPGEKAWLQSFQLRPANGWEVVVYAISAFLFIVLIAAGYSGYFNDILTFSFLASFAAAIFFLFRRIF